MSSFITKIGALANKAVSDPEAEKEYRDQQAASKATIKQIQAELAQSRNQLRELKIKKTIYIQDATIYEKEIEKAAAYLSEAGGTAAADIREHVQDEFRPYQEFLVMAQASDGGRYKLWRMIDICKQALRDTRNASATNIKQLNDLIEQTTEFLNDNIVSPASLYKTYYDTSFTTRFQNNPSTDKDLLTMINLAAAKVQRNNGLDFHEGDALPENPTDAQRAAAGAAEEKAKDSFSLANLFKDAANYTVTVAAILIGIFICLLGSSMAVNLNVYKPYPYKILYAIWGFVFGIVVLGYVIGYRWLYRGKQPKYYGFLPFIPRYFKNYYVQMLLGWLTYKPDHKIWDLQEWRQVAADLKHKGPQA
jgi:sarcosine oxidase delta subunit